MSKRKRPSIRKTSDGSPRVDDSTDDIAVKDDMVHVTPDLLAGSPDIFAGKRSDGPAGQPEVASEPIEPAPTSSNLTPEPEAAPPAPPPYVEATPYAVRQRSGGSSVLGIVFVVIGLFALMIVLTGTDLTQYGWPLFVIVPGLTLLVLGFVSVGAGATI